MMATGIAIRYCSAAVRGMICNGTARLTSNAGKNASSRSSQVRCRPRRAVVALLLTFGINDRRVLKAIAAVYNPPAGARNGSSCAVWATDQMLSKPLSSCPSPPAEGRQAGRGGARCRVRLRKGSIRGDGQTAAQ